MNWLLTSGIFSALNCLELNDQWDLSIGENAKLAESFYASLHKELPKNKEEWHIIFEKAYCATWGDDHTCDQVKDSELWTFLTSMVDCYSYDCKINPIDYCDSLGIIRRSST